ncbi:YbaK/EbsC family protein [Gorillibacterium sp. sgz5001074]|uniref:YbaK/EbsC family protein n=1 Tax=Gorillibacterium sp. sgz5001074 TaxID=3446695 RepID=UPI003F66EEDD
MSDEWNEGAERVQEALRAAGHEGQVRFLPDSARTAQAAADALGCSVAQIAKSIVFRLAGSGEPLLVVASGTNRVNEERVGRLLEETLSKADAVFVRESTGFAIGGVSPVGHVRPIRIIIDEDLFLHRELWAAAGHPKSVFPLGPDDLVRLTGGSVMAVK